MLALGKQIAEYPIGSLREHRENNFHTMSGFISVPKGSDFSEITSATILKPSKVVQLTSVSAKMSFEIRFKKY